MKALFTGFLTVSISTSLMIGIVLLLRLIFKKAPKALICGVWALVILRLLLPFQIPLEFSLRPKTPVFTQASTAVVDQQQVYEQTEIPPFVPVQEQGSFFPAVVIDYMQIAAYVWCIGLTAMLGYMVFTYLRMKYLLRESVKRGEGVYENGALPTAFLLGYIRPRIYLPTGMSNETAELVIRHERAHLRRGDNWLKLVAYICLAIHWYNPLVWVMYLLLCRDIEGACDESVIRTLDAQGRGDYSAALLSCGKGKPNFAGCPVAFGEVSIGQRIRNVLNLSLIHILEKLQTLLKMQEKPLSILGAIGTHVRRLGTARTLLDNGKGVSDFMRIYNVREYPAEKSMRSAKRFSARFCAVAAELVMETDMKLKTSYDDPERLLEILVLQLAQEARNG